MASSSSHHNNDIPLSTLLEWYKIRDTLLGENQETQNVPLAIELASSCQHPDAVWLTEVFAGKGATSVDEAKNVFLSFGENDARSLVFAWVLGAHGVHDRLAPLRRSAELGFAFGQAQMACFSRASERLRFAKLAAAQGERDGFYWLGRACCDDEGSKDAGLALDMFKRAAELDHALGILTWASLKAGDEQYYWLTRSAQKGFGMFVPRLFEEVRKFLDGSGRGSRVFWIGKGVKGHVNYSKRTIFGASLNFLEHVSFANQAIEFYDFQIVSYKKAVDTWTLVGIRWGVVKDIRKLIAKLIWDSRHESKYKRMVEAIDGFESDGM
jgi:hypothetical protein